MRRASGWPGANPPANASSPRGVSGRVTLAACLLLVPLLDLAVSAVKGLLDVLAVPCGIAGLAVVVWHVIATRRT